MLFFYLCNLYTSKATFDLFDWKRVVLLNLQETNNHKVVFVIQVFYN